MENLKLFANHGLLFFCGLALCWCAWISAATALEGLRIERSGRPPDQPYRAHVVGRVSHGGFRVRLSSLVVEIQFTDGTTTRFTSRRVGAFHLLGVGSEVRVLTTKAIRSRYTFESYEIDNAFELWIQDALWALAIVACAAFVLIFQFFAWRTQPSLQFSRRSWPTIRRLFRPRR